jgi:small multidrug resistance pump
MAQANDRHDVRPGWPKRWLIAAGAYNLVWGAAVILFPGALFAWAGMDAPRYPQIWQCVGMIVGVYGVGYLIAASDHRTHWPIILVGLLGKIFGPIGFAFALVRGDFPPVFGLTIITNDLVWWIPFSMMLRDAARSRGAPDRPDDEASARRVEAS